MDPTTLFSNAIEVKQATHGAFLSDPNLAEVLSSLRSTDRKGGTIFVIGTGTSRFSAEHLAEEFQVRFRANRPAVAAVSLTEYADELLPLLARTFKAVDSIVAFAEPTSNGHIAATLRYALAQGTNCVVICDHNSAELLELRGHGAHLLTIAGQPSAATRFSIQRAFLHGICEGFEPEFDGDDRAAILKSLAESIAVDQTIVGLPDLINRMITMRNALTERVNAGGSIFLFGNGGSACDAQELTANFRTCVTKKGIPVLATNFLQAGYMTCAMNDGFELFRRGIEGIRGEHHVVLAYSTSGASANVNQAVRLARENGYLTLALTGKNGGELAQIAEMSIIVPSQNTARIQEAHTLIGFFLASSLG